MDFTIMKYNEDLFTAGKTFTVTVRVDTGLTQIGGRRSEPVTVTISDQEVPPF